MGCEARTRTVEQEAVEALPQIRMACQTAMGLPAMFIATNQRGQHTRVAAHTDPYQVRLKSGSSAQKASGTPQNGHHPGHLTSS